MLSHTRTIASSTLELHRKRSLIAAFAVMALLGTGARTASADVTLRHMHRPSTATLEPTRRDPKAFMQALESPVVAPVAVLSREDAVAEEMLTHATILSRDEAIATAHALCDEARHVGYDPLLFLAVIHVESSFNHLAVSGVGAEGLMQIMPDTAAFLADRQKLERPENHTFDPVLNVRIGVRYLAQLDQRFHHHMDRSLTAYNRGPGATHAILMAHGTLPASVRRPYAGRVLSQYKVYVRHYGHLPLR